MRIKRQPLVCQFLEHASSQVLETHGSHLRDLVGRSHGVYSLYKRDRLYYVGLASNLRGRLDQHLRDRHKGLWDNFSVYLTLDSGFMKELESLVLRIAKPAGNKQRGKFTKAQSLLKTIKRRIKDEQETERDALFAGHIRKPRGVVKAVKLRRGGKGAARSSRTVVLAKYPGRPTLLAKVFKGKKMSGHLGFETCTVQNLKVVQVDKDKNLLLVKGATPGFETGRVIVTPAIKDHDRKEK